MVTLQPFTSWDLLKYNRVQFDPLTETYGFSFYMSYMARWPEYMQKIETASGQLIGYIMGKAEGRDENWHGHVTCLTIRPDYRRRGMAGLLMTFLENISEAKKTYFVDLFVRKSNENAIGMYKRMGYVVYRTVLEYYSGDPDEDAYDMRKALERDVEKKSIIPLDHPVRTEDLE